MMGEGVGSALLRGAALINIPHALEEAQHMERICLLQGLDDPNNKPRVDVLVPDGRIEAYEPEVEGTGYEMDLRAGADDLISDITKTANVGAVVTDAQKKSAGDARLLNQPHGSARFNLIPRSSLLHGLLNRVMSSLRIKRQCCAAQRVVKHWIAEALPSILQDACSTDAPACG